MESRLLFSGPSAFGHITDGQFDIINGHQEWSDIQPAVFNSSQSYLYADQANLNHPAGSPPDTFMLMYDETGETTPIGPNQYFTVGFTTVENEDGHNRLNQYSDHIFTDGTITFLENGVVQSDAQGNTRVQSIGGQEGKAGFGTSPNSSTPHVIVEFQITLSANQSVLNGGYSPDPQFWTSDPPQPPDQPPIANDDTARINIGDPSIDINVLGSRHGTKRPRLIRPPSMSFLNRSNAGPPSPTVTGKRDLHTVGQLPRCGHIYIRRGGHRWDGVECRYR